MNAILNLTQHPASETQLAAGVMDLAEKDREILKSLLTFERIPNKTVIVQRAKAIALLADGWESKRAMIGGAPYLMTHLEQALIGRAITPLYAFSRRDSVDKTMPDGSVRKVGVFKHLGFIESW